MLQIPPGPFYLGPQKREAPDFQEASAHLMIDQQTIKDMPRVIRASYTYKFMSLLKV